MKDFPRIINVFREDIIVDWTKMEFEKPPYPSVKYKKLEGTHEMIKKFWSGEEQKELYAYYKPSSIDKKEYILSAVPSPVSPYHHK